MESQILSAIGLDSIDPALWIIGLLALVIVLLIVIIVAFGKIKKVNARCDNLLRGKTGESLEGILTKRFDIIDKLEEEDAVKTSSIDTINKKLIGSFQKYGIRKYDAFSEMGGKLSFALCLLNEKDCGFIINAMHSREGSYTYIKEIKNGVSQIALSEEEEKALSRALSM